MVKTINRAFLEDILSPLTGWADLDDISKFLAINPDDKIAMKAIVTEYFKPYFEKQSQSYKEKLKEVFMYYLTSEKLDFERAIESCLLPFSTPSTPINLYKWMWEVLWPDEDFRIDNLKDYIEKDDIYEPVRYSLKK